MDTVEFERDVLEQVNALLEQNKLDMRVYAEQLAAQVNTAFDKSDANRKFDNAAQREVFEQSGVLVKEQIAAQASQHADVLKQNITNVRIQNACILYASPIGLNQQQCVDTVLEFERMFGELND